MALTTTLDEDLITKGETKQIIVTPKDEDDTAITPSTLTAAFTKPSGTTETKTKSDFTQDGNAWDLQYTFDETGVWHIVITGTDSQGNTEKVSFDRLVSSE